MLDNEQAELLNKPFSPKFLATKDRNGLPNLVVITAMEYYREKLIFGNLFMWKTAENLNNEPEVTVLAADSQLNYFCLKGHFSGWQETGEFVERLNNSEMVRYNAYSGIRAAGVIDIKETTPPAKLHPAKVLVEYLKSRTVFRGGKADFPEPAAKVFERLDSIKPAAYQDGTLEVILLPAVRVNGSYLQTSVTLPVGRPFAACGLTADIVSFQVKGTVEPEGLKVTRAYANGPPVPGKLIYETS